MNKRIVVFAPHPDDETLGCGGTILKKIHEGFEVFIVLLTGGQNALLAIFGINSNPTPGELKSIRIHESQSVARILGIPSKNWFFLDYEYGKIQSNGKRVGEDMISFLSKFRPQEVFLPFEKDVNNDHQATGRILHHCLTKLSFHPLIFEYSIAQRVSRLSPLCARLLNPILHGVVFVDISPFLERKRRQKTNTKAKYPLFQTNSRGLLYITQHHSQESLRCFICRNYNSPRFKRALRSQRSHESFQVVLFNQSYNF